MKRENRTKKQLLESIEALELRLEEAEETLRAIQNGDVDAVVIRGAQGEQVFTLTGAEYAYRVLIETMNEGALTLTSHGTILYCNKCFAKMIKKPLERVLGTSLRSYVMPSDLEAYDSLFQPATGIEKKEVTLLSDDGILLPAYLAISRLNMADRPGMYCLVITDLTEHKAEEQIRASLRENEVLLREIHHRVKNNLQIIASLLKLQARNIEDSKIQEVFRESQNRIRTMASVHSMLYRSASLAEINLGEYCRELAGILFRSYSADPQAITLQVWADDILLPIDIAIPCSLVLNELISNALKHAFPAGMKGAIRIEIKRDKNNLRILFEDNGAGFPDDLDCRNTKSMGLQLVTMLVEQLDGNIDLIRNCGTKYVITLRAGKTKG